MILHILKTLSLIQVQVQEQLFILLLQFLQVQPQRSSFLLLLLSSPPLLTFLFFSIINKLSLVIKQDNYITFFGYFIILTFNLSSFLNSFDQLLIIIFKWLMSNIIFLILLKQLPPNTHINRSLLYLLRHQLLPPGRFWLSKIKVNSPHTLHFIIGNRRWSGLIWLHWFNWPGGFNKWGLISVWVWVLFSLCFLHFVMGDGCVIDFKLLVVGAVQRDILLIIVLEFTEVRGVLV